MLPTVRLWRRRPPHQRVPLTIQTRKSTGRRTPMRFLYSIQRTRRAFSMTYPDDSLPTEGAPASNSRKVSAEESRVKGASWPALGLDAAAYPVAIHARRCLLWNRGKFDRTGSREWKKPITADGSGSRQKKGESIEDARERAWFTLPEALAKIEKDPDLDLGIALDGTIGGIDLDHIFDEAGGPIAVESVREFVEFAVSEGYRIDYGPSGDGLHIFVSLTDELRKAWPTSTSEVVGQRESGAAKPIPRKVEAWHSGRYLTFTGKSYEGSGRDIKAPSAELLRRLRVLIGDDVHKDGGPDAVSVNLAFPEAHAALIAEVELICEIDEELASVWSYDLKAHRGWTGSEFSMSLMGRLANLCGDGPGVKTQVHR